MASRLQDVLLRGTSGARPAAATVAIGTLYYSTDLQETDQSDGTNWNTWTDAGTGSSSSVSSGLSAPYFPDIEESVYEPQIPIPGPPGSSASLTAAQKTRQIGIVVDGGGSVLTTGIKGFKSFPIAGTIIGVRLLADQSGSIVIDIWKDVYANYPPTVADTITAAAKPTITTDTDSEDTTLTGWTTAVAAGDVFGFNIDSVTTITRIILELTIEVI